MGSFFRVAFRKTISQSPCHPQTDTDRLESFNLEHAARVMALGARAHCVRLTWLRWQVILVV